MPHTHQVAWDRLSGEVVLDLPRTAGEGSTIIEPSYRFDAVAAFGRSAPLVVEIGSGSGDALVAGSIARPEWDFLAFEVWRPGIGHALAKMGDRALPNVRIVEADAALALQTMVEPGSVREVWTFFPDPWPKQRHHKRRIVSPDLVDAVVAALGDGGVWRLATDWAAYAAAMREVIGGDQRLSPASGDRAPLRPLTRFERRATAEGREIVDLAYVRAERG